MGRVRHLPIDNTFLTFSQIDGHRSYARVLRLLYRGKMAGPKQLTASVTHERIQCVAQSLLALVYVKWFI